MNTTQTIRAINKCYYIDGKRENLYIVDLNTLHTEPDSFLNHLIDVQVYGYANIPYYYSEELIGQLGVFLIENTIEDDGEYDMDNNYEPYYVEEQTYHPIKYHPITGQKFHIQIDKEIDITDQYNQTMKRREEILKKPHKKRTKREQKELENTFHMFDRVTLVSPHVYQNLLDTYKEDELYG